MLWTIWCLSRPTKWLSSRVGVEDIAVSDECCGGEVWEDYSAGVECGDGFLL